jgi:hypothetical protein
MTMKNVYYEELMKVIETRPSACPDKSFCSLYGVTPDPNYHNIGGNMNIVAHIPITGVPNYFYAFNKYATDFFKTLFSFIIDENGLSDVPTASLSEANTTPAVNFKDKVTTASETTHQVINWNYGRTGLTETVFKQNVGFFISAFNELIDYIITNSVTAVNEKLQLKFGAIFGSSGSVYNYAVYTLLLPAMVNWFASNRKANELSAHYYMGHVNKEVDFFPLKKNESWSTVSKIAEQAKTIKLSEIVSVPYKVGTFIYSKYCFPLTSAMIAAGNGTIATPTGALDYVPSTVTFKSDKFGYSTAFKEMIYGKTYQITKITNTTTETRALTTSDWVAQTTGLQKYKCTAGCTACDSSTKGCAKRVNKWYKTGCKSCKYHGIVWNRESCKYCGEAGYWSYECETPGPKNATHVTDGTIKTWKLKTDKVNPSDLQSWSKADVNKLYVENSVPTNLGSQANGTACKVVPTPTEVALKPSDALRFVGKTYLQCDNNAKVEISNADTARKNKEYINPYRTQFELFYISTDLVKHWLSLVESIENVKIVLSEIRSILSKYPSIILWHFLTKHWQPYLAKATNQVFINNPIGPLCMRPTNQFILEYMNYMSSYSLKSTSLSWNTDKTFYSQTISLYAGTKNKTYLSNVVSSIINASKAEGVKPEDLAYCIDIPAYGYQLYDLISNQATGYLTEPNVAHVVRIDAATNTDEHSVYATNKARIVITFKDLPAELSNMYQKIMDVHVSTASLVRDDAKKEFVLSINSINGDVPTEYAGITNTARVYVSTKTPSLGVTYVVLDKHTTKDEASGKIYPYFVLEYNANDTPSIPGWFNKRTF